MRIVICVVGAVAMTVWAGARAGATEPAGAVFYVATGGNDAWSGRVAAPDAGKTDGPFATIHRARDAVRAMKAAGLTAPVRVLVRGGTYYLREPIVFTPADSGTAECPITYRAYPGERPVLSAGRPVTGWTTRDGKRYTAAFPEATTSTLGFRQLRVGMRRRIRARYPNYDPKRPIQGGWLFARAPGKRTSAFGTCMACIHNVGDYMEYDITVPADGLYSYWCYVAMLNKPHSPKDVTGCSAVSVDGGKKQPLMNMHDTGSWQKFQWRQAASLRLTKGKHRLRWENLKGGGINFDLFALCDDPTWNPTGKGIPPCAKGRHLLVVQAEGHVKAEGPQMVKTDCGCTYQSKTDLYADPGTIKSWPQSPDIEVHIFPRWGWVSGIVPVAKREPEKNRLVVDKKWPEFFWSGNRFFVENAREELDAPDEWYLDRKTGTVSYLRADVAPDKAPTVLSGLDRAIEFRGDPAGKKPVRHIRVEGLVITDTDYSRDHLSWYFPDNAAVWMVGAEDCRVARCLFHDIGGWALTIRWASRGNVFEGNTVVRAGMGGVYIAGGTKKNPHFGGPRETSPTQNVVSGNHIHHCGKIFAHVAGVYISSAWGNIARHNLVHHMPRYGLSIKYQSGENVFEHNHVHHTNLETNDTGGIEIYYNFQGSTVRSNIVGDTIGLKTTGQGEMFTPFYTWGIYLDGMTSKATVEGNIVYRNFIGGVMINGGSDNTIVNNVFVESHKQQAYFNNYKGTGKRNTFLRNIVSYRREESLTYMCGRYTPEWLTCDRNLLWHAGKPLRVQVYETGKKPQKPDWEGWTQRGMDTHSVVADPKFVDPARDDYRLKPNSPALGLGFKPIDTSKIGLAGAPVRPPAWHR